MKLHEAIEKLLQIEGFPMNASQISDSLNEKNWYQKVDRSLILPAQITARVNKHPFLFNVDKTVRPLLIAAKSMYQVNGKKVAAFQAIGQKSISSGMVPSALKASFDPICNFQTRVLVLGTLPGDQSLCKKEYYGNPRNRFWKVIAHLANKEEVWDYESKLLMLSGLEIGLWDVVHNSQRLGSLDSAIQDERVNDLDGLIEAYPGIRVIAFNGKKSQVLFDKYFKRNPKLHYVSLPSTSPANASWSLDRLYPQWESLIG